MYQLADSCCFPHIEKAAPIIGPNKNPRLKATPIRAIPFPRLLGVETSVTIAVERLTFPEENHENHAGEVVGYDNDL